MKKLTSEERQKIHTLRHETRLKEDELYSPARMPKDRNYDVAIVVGVVVILAILGYCSLRWYWLPETMIDRIFPIQTSP